jgi:hypothetical protein
MDISEVKAALGKKVMFRNERLQCDSDYTLTGCIIRRDEKYGFFYQAELTKEHSVIIASLHDVFPVCTEPITEKNTPTRQRAENASDMLDGCRNRLFVTKNPDEIPSLYSGALYHLRIIVKYAYARLAKKEEQP